MAQMSKLPLELYRPVCELLKFEDLLNITLVCRAFQREAGRYLLWKLIFRGLKEDGVAECVERFLRFPRSHQYVQRLDVFASREAVADSLISLLLGKLTNLIALTLCGRQYCGNIFENSTFQLHFLFTSFVLDQEFSAFLKTQPSITEWRTSSSWESSPGRDERDRLSPDILPNLAVFCNSSNDPNFDIQIHNGRNITHISMAQFSAPVSLPKLPHPLHVKALDVYCAAMELLEVLPDILPNLECLALIDYDAIEVPYHPPSYNDPNLTSFPGFTRETHSYRAFYPAFKGSLRSKSG
jgi:hypothetical protein